MEILFCDICNESVPLPDLNTGHAFVRKGRVVCARCDLAMGGEKELPTGEATIVDRDPAPAGAAAHGAAMHGARGARGGGVLAGAAGDPPAREGAGALLVGLVALTVAAVGLWLVIERVDDLERRQGQVAVDLRGELEGARRARAGAAADTNARLEEFRAELGRQPGALEALLAERAASLEASLAAAREREADLVRDVDGLRLRMEEVRDEARRARDTGSQRVSELEREAAFLRDQLILVEENLRVAGASTPAFGAAAAAPATAEAVSWERFLPDLASADDGIRVDAVIALGDTRDPAVVVHVLPLLQDASLFVRMVAAEALGKVGEPASVPALIETLEDERPAVREQALFALEAITGEDLGFNPTASESERQKRVRGWRDWWSKNRDRLLGT